jgi:hypothetical protein
VQPHRQAGQPDGEPDDDDERRRQRAPGEPAPVGRAELAQLGDGGGGASVPVASAIATGKENTTANSGSPSGPVTGAWPEATAGWVNPCTKTATAAARNSSVITANVSRPPCPNQVSPTTSASRPRPSTTRAGASEGR